jgi:hypothetical protein
MEDTMTAQTVLFWASRNLFTVATVCFGAVMLSVMLYAYLDD